MHAQSIDFQWARSASGPGLDHGVDVASDGNGNIYVTGHYRSDSIAFGSIVLVKEPGPSSSSAIFLAKYDAGGDVLWARSAGGNATDISNGVAVDPDGNACIVGAFQSDSLSFGTTTLFNTVTNGSTEDVFVAKFDPDGNVLWARSAGGSSGSPRDFGNAVAVDGNGNVCIGGYFRSQNMAFGPFLLTNIGQADAFIAKYDANGDVLWARSEAGGGGDLCTALDVDASGNIYAAGHYYSNSITIGTTTLTNTNNVHDLFMAKYDADGNPLWARGASGNGDDWCTGLAADASGNMIVTGWFNGFPITFGSLTLPNAGSKDIFIAKYSTLGEVLWAQSAGEGYAEESGAIATDASGSVYLTGLFGISISFGSTTINGGVGSNVFVAKYDPDGDALWALGASGIVDEQGSGIAVEGADNLYVTGSFDSPSLACGPDTLLNTGPSDVLIANLNLVMSLQDRDPFSGIEVYPNPFSNRATLRTAAPMKNAAVTILNELGHTVRVIRNVRGSQVTIIRDDLPVGIYVIEVREGDKHVTSGRIVVMD